MNRRTKKNILWCRNKTSIFPKLHRESPLNHKSEGFTVCYANGVINIKGNNAVSESYAEHCIHALLPSAHWPEFLGVSQPRFAFRPLWLDGDVRSWLLSQAEGSFPLLSNQIFELGYNALILGGINHVCKESIAALKPHMDRLLKSLNEKKIQLALNLSGLFDTQTTESDLSKIQESIFEDINGVHLIAVTSRVQEEYLDFKDGKTYIERLIEDIHQLESMIKDRLGLIYYLPYNKSFMENKNNFLRDLSLGISPKTLLAFSSVSGCPSQDHLVPHPFWNELRCMPEVLGVRLLPIVQVAEHIGSSIRYDLFETYFSRCLRHKFAGIAAYASTLPTQGDFNHCNLWVAGQMQWRPWPAALCIETWFKSFHPEIDYSECQPILKQIRSLVSEIKAMTSKSNKHPYPPEELRLIHDSWVVNLKVLKMKIDKIQSSQSQQGKDEHIFMELNKFLKDAEKALHFM